ENQTTKVYKPAYKPNHMAYMFSPMMSKTRPYDVVNQGQPLTADQSWATLDDGDAFLSLVDKPGRPPGRGGPGRPPGRGGPGRPPGRGGPGRPPDRGGPGRPPGRGGPHALHDANADGDGLIGEEEPSWATLDNDDAFLSLADKPGRLPGRDQRLPGRGRPLPSRGGPLPDKRLPHALHHANADRDGLIGEVEPSRALHHANADCDGLIGRRSLLVYSTRLMLTKMD
ncbi:hypothetical protein F2P56_026481, partial [Juglans regia]